MRVRLNINVTYFFSDAKFVLFENLNNSRKYNLNMVTNTFVYNSNNNNSYGIYQNYDTTKLMSWYDHDGFYNLIKLMKLIM